MNRFIAVALKERDLAARWTFYIGADGKILSIDTDVNPFSAGPDVVATLDELRKRGQIYFSAEK